MVLKSDGAGFSKKYIWTRSEMRTKIHQNSGIFRSPKKSILPNLDFNGPIFGYKVYKGMINDICQLKFKYLPY